MDEAGLREVDTLAVALALPLLDLSAIDAVKLPKNIIDAKLASQYQIVVLGKGKAKLDEVVARGVEPAPWRFLVQASLPPRPAAARFWLRVARVVARN